MTQPRQPKGTPAGGRWAPSQAPESSANWTAEELREAKEAGIAFATYAEARLFATHAEVMEACASGCEPDAYRVLRWTGCGHDEALYALHHSGHRTQEDVAWSYGEARTVTRSHEEALDAACTLSRQVFPRYLAWRQRGADHNTAMMASALGSPSSYKT